MSYESGNTILQHKQEDVHSKYHSNDCYEHVEHMPSLASVAHLQENAKDVEWEQRNECYFDSLRYYNLKFVKTSFKRLRTKECYSQSHSECCYQSRHHVDQWWYVDCEKRFKSLDFGNLLHSLTMVDEQGEDFGAGKVGKVTREHGVAIGDDSGQQKQFSGTLANVADGWSDKSNYDEWNEELNELAEDAVECDKHPYCG